MFQNPLRLTDPTGESPAALRPILIAADGPFPVGDIACGCPIVATAAAAINAANGTGEALNNPALPANCPNPPYIVTAVIHVRICGTPHEQKLREYMANLYAHDNQGHLAGNPASLHQQIIDGRIRSLQRQIENFRKLLEQCERENGGR